MKEKDVFVRNSLEVSDFMDYLEDSVSHDRKQQIEEILITQEEERAVLEGLVNLYEYLGTSAKSQVNDFLKGVSQSVNDTLHKHPGYVLQSLAAFLCISTIGFS
ncbi:MAG: hypothetical protein AAF388_16240 [Bacteroidota bacterium]